MIILNYKGIPCLLLRMWEDKRLGLGRGFWFELLYKNKKIRTFGAVLTKSDFESAEFNDNYKIFYSDERIKSNDLEEINLYDNKL